MLSLIAFYLVTVDSVNVIKNMFDKSGRTQNFLALMPDEFWKYMKSFDFTLSIWLKKATFFKNGLQQKL